MGAQDGGWQGEKPVLERGKEESEQKVARDEAVTALRLLGRISFPLF